MFIFIHSLFISSTPSTSMNSVSKWWWQWDREWQQAFYAHMNRQRTFQIWQMRAEIASVVTGFIRILQKKSQVFLNKDLKCQDRSEIKSLQSHKRSSMSPSVGSMGAQTSPEIWNDVLKPLLLFNVIYFDETDSLLTWRYILEFAFKNKFYENLALTVGSYNLVTFLKF